METKPIGVLNIKLLNAGEFHVKVECVEEEKGETLLVSALSTNMKEKFMASFDASALKLITQELPQKASKLAKIINDCLKNSRNDIIFRPAFGSNRNSEKDRPLPGDSLFMNFSIENDLASANYTLELKASKIEIQDILFEEKGNAEGVTQLQQQLQKLELKYEALAKELKSVKEDKTNNDQLEQLKKSVVTATRKAEEAASYSQTNSSKLYKLENARADVVDILQFSKAIYMKLDKGQSSGNATFWTWTNTVHNQADHFTLSTTSQVNDSVIILKKGVYEVNIRVAFNNSANSTYTALYVNSVEVSRAYMSYNTNFTASTVISELFEFQPNTKLQVYQTYNSGPMKDNFSNVFCILKISES